MHIALALRRKTICLIGPTSPSEIDVYEIGEKIVAESNCICCYRSDCKSMEKINAQLEKESPSRAAPICFKIDEEEVMLKEILKQERMTSHP